MYLTETFDENTMARARIRNAVVSVKDSREVSAALRGKTITQGLALLFDVKARKRAIRFTRYNHESAGHKPGIGPGRYPFKAAEAFETLLNSVRANAEFKDLDIEALRIVHIKADPASRPFRFGRHRGRKGKRAHLEIVVIEDEKLKPKRKNKKPTKKAVSETTDESSVTPTETTAKVEATSPVPSETKKPAKKSTTKPSTASATSVKASKVKKGEDQ